MVERRANNVVVRTSAAGEIHILQESESADFPPVVITADQAEQLCQWIKAAQQEIEAARDGEHNIEPRERQEAVVPGWMVGEQDEPRSQPPSKG